MHVRTPQNTGPARQKRLCKHNKAKNGGKKGRRLYKTAFFFKFGTLAGVAQLVERDLPKVDVEGSRPFSRSKKEKPPNGWFSFFVFDGGSLPLVAALPFCHSGAKGDRVQGKSSTTPSPKGTPPKTPRSE